MSLRIAILHTHETFYPDLLLVAAVDQCPVTFDQPFDMNGIAESSVIGQPTARIAPCVANTHRLENLVTIWKGVMSAAMGTKFGMF